MTDPVSKMEVLLRVVDLPPGSKGYQLVLEKFNKTMAQGSKYKSIVKIQRIQNPSLYEHFSVKKKQLESRNSKGTENERWLFHGTNEASVKSINKNGFDRNFRGKNGMCIIYKYW